MCVCVCGKACECRLLPAAFCLSLVRAGRVCCPRFFQGAISSFLAIIFRFSPRTHTHTHRLWQQRLRDRSVVSETGASMRRLW